MTSSQHHSHQLLTQDGYIPILAITQYGAEEYFDGSIVFVCFSLVENLLPCLFFIGSIVIFFICPLVILICIFSLIAKTLMGHPNSVIPPKSTSVPSQSVIKYRKQVILMLGTVVLAFFICLLPFRALTLWIIVAPAGSNFKMGLENYYNMLYFCRIMFHINSAINPILYNIMSSKFRGGFLKMCGVRHIRKKYKKKTDMTRKSTHSSTHTSSQQTTDTATSSTKRHSQSGHVAKLEHVKEVSLESVSSPNNYKNRPTREFYVRAPLEIINGISGQKLPNGEIYV